MHETKIWLKIPGGRWVLAMRCTANEAEAKLAELRLKVSPPNTELAISDSPPSN